MEIVKKPDIRVFASEAKTGEVLSFPDVLRGWGITLDQTQGKPPLEWMNDAFNRIDLNNLYLLQQGIPEWDGAIRYPVNSIIKHTGKIYLCSVENENNEPSASSDKWSLYIRNASEKEAGIAKIATQTEVNAGTNDTSFVTPKKLKVKIDAIPEASLTQKGIVQLTSTLSDDEGKGATPKMVNDTDKKAAEAKKRADDAHTALAKKLDTRKVKTALSTSTTDVPAMKLLNDLRNELLSKEVEVLVDQIFIFDGAVPTGFVERKGQVIDEATMPKLFARYGANMPDDRDRVHRMSGTLAGNVGTTQEDAIRNIVGKFSATRAWGDEPSGAFLSTSGINGTRDIDHVTGRDFSFDASRVVPTASENRVKSRIVIFCNKIQ